MVRQAIETILYSKKSIGIDFVLESGLEVNGGGSETGREGRFPLPIDGKMDTDGAALHPVRSAKNRTTSTDWVGNFRPEENDSTGGDSTAAAVPMSSHGVAPGVPSLLGEQKNGGVFETA
jgi:hypothetical protein